MDQSALNNLLTAKRLLSVATQFSVTGERYACTAGSIALLDALELVLLACLIEIKVSPTDYAHLDKLIGDLEKAGFTVPNKTRVMGLNRSRGGNKHFGNTIDQYALNDFLKYTVETIDYLVIKIFGKPYHEIYSAELIQHQESKALIEEAARILDITPFYPYMCLINIRKAIFINFEEEYSIEKWKNIKKGQELSLFEELTFKTSAPFYKKNKEWIDQHVLNLFNYVQFDYGELRSRLIEYGIASANFFNLLRLTPSVFRSKGDREWKFEGKLAFMETSKTNASYCLSIAIEMIQLKESYMALHRHPPEEFKIQFQVRQPTFLYRKASLQSEVLRKIECGEVLSINAFVPSFDDDSHFLSVSELRMHPRPEWLIGYLPEEHACHLDNSNEKSYAGHTAELINCHDAEAMQQESNLSTNNRQE